MLTNAKIKEIQKLTEKSKARREAGLFVIEGPRMFIETPLEWIEEIYVTQRFLDNADSGLLGMTEGPSVDGDSTETAPTSPSSASPASWTTLIPDCRTQPPEVWRIVILITVPPFEPPR